MKKEAIEYYKKKAEQFSDKEDRLRQRAAVDLVTVQKNKRVYLIAACGKAMASLGGLFKDIGFEVRGADSMCYPPMRDVILDVTTQYFDGFNEKNISEKDLVVVGNAVGSANVEAKYVREKDFPYISVAEALQLFFLKGRKSIVVAGTHGKTTTTGMMAHVLDSAGKDPGYLVGGVISSTGKSYAAGAADSEFFVVEGDEYDTAYFDKAPKNIHYLPYIAVVTSVEFDHADIYKDMDDYKKAFEFFVKEIPKEGHLFLCGDRPETDYLASFAESSVYTYGLSEKNILHAKNIVTDEKGQTFDVVFKEENIGRLTVPLWGEYNLQNTLSVIGMSLMAGLSFEQIKTGVATFSGMKRRQEVIWEKGNITLIDDFAHHPTAVDVTLRGIRERYGNDRRIVALFEPRSTTSRKKMFEADYGHAFSTADKVVLCIPALRPQDNPNDFIDTNNVCALINSHNTESICVSSVEDVVKEVSKNIKPGDVIVFMSNGDFGGIGSKLIDLLA